MGKVNRAFDCGQREVVAGHGEFEMDAREDFRIGFGALGLEGDRAAADRMAPAFEDQYDIVRGASACADQNHLHGARREVVAATVGCAVHGRDMAGASSCDEKHAVGATPVNSAFHA